MTDWMKEENQSAEILPEGQVANPSAPRLVQTTRMKAPTRSTKGFYIQDAHSHAFDELVLIQKRQKGPKAPDLIEEAIELLLNKYNVAFEKP